MIQIKTVRLSSIIKITASFFILITGIILSIALISKNISNNPINNMYLSFKNNYNPDIICKEIINKSIPVFYTQNSNYNKIVGDSFVGYTLLKYFTNIDINNPKSYIVSEIPLLGLFDVKIFSGMLSNIQGIDNTTKKDNVSNPSQAVSLNFNLKPIENKNLDYTNPSVIIFHTHACESFMQTDTTKYDMFGEFRTLDKNFSTCRIGEEIKIFLETYYGIPVIHDTTLHDYPVYEGSYSRSKITVENLLKKYPNAKLILDIHRDAFEYTEERRNNMMVSIRGDIASKVMFVIGKNNPHWQENYQLTLKLQQKIEQLYPGITKSNYIVSQVYNQNISNKMLLIEIGSDCNTIDEAIISAKMVANSIGNMLSEN